MRNFAFLLLLAAPAVAGTVQFSDRTLWQAAAGATTNIDFEGFTDPDSSYTYYPQPPGLTLNHVTFTAPAFDAEGQDSYLFVIDPAYSSDYDWGSGAVLSAQGGPNQVLATFDNPVFAFGLDLFSTGTQASDYLVTLSTGDSFTVNTANQPVKTFFGVVTDTDPIYWARFAPQSEGADAGLDNFEFNDSVPEPAAASMMILGLAGILALKRKRGAIGGSPLFRSHGG